MTAFRAVGFLALRRRPEILEYIQSWPEVGQTFLAYGLFKATEDPLQSDRSSSAPTRSSLGAHGWLAETAAAQQAPAR